MDAITFSILSMGFPFNVIMTVFWRVDFHVGMQNAGVHEIHCEGITWFI